MAKFVGLVGTGRGRAGNYVFSKRDGMTIVKAYQPQVANPRTPGQVEQRAKLKLASQVAMMLGDFGRHVLLANGHRANQRGTLVRDIYKLVTQTEELGVLSLRTVLGDLTGLVNKPFHAPSITLSAAGGTITASVPMPSVVGTLVTIVVIHNDIVFPEAHYAQRVLVSDGGTGNVTCELPYDATAVGEGFAHAFILESYPTTDTVLSVGENNKAEYGNANQYNSEPYIASLTRMAPGLIRNYTNIGYARVAVEGE